MELLKTNIAWLRDQISGMNFGEVGIKVVVHNGKIKRIEKSIVEKEQGNDNS